MAQSSVNPEEPALSQDQGPAQLAWQNRPERMSQFYSDAMAPPPPPAPAPQQATTQLAQVSAEENRAPRPQAQPAAPMAAPSQPAPPQPQALPDQKMLKPANSQHPMRTRPLGMFEKWALRHRYPTRSLQNMGLQRNVPAVTPTDPSNWNTT